MTFKDALEKKIKEIAEKWGRSNIYYVGGYVRDELIRKYFPDDSYGTFKDVDLVIDMENGSEEFVKFLKKEYPDNCKDFAEYPRFGTAKFTLYFDGMTKADGVTPWIRDIEVECVAPRSEEYNNGPRKPSSVKAATIKEDAMRRDFCCNALYKNVITKEILDPTGRGINDLKNKLLRTPLDPIITYKDDPLRMLRVIRFAAKKDFAIEENTFKAISPIPEYYQLSMERVNAEFSQILSSYNPTKYIWMLHETGLLKYIIPEYEEAWGFNQNSKYHSMNLTDHCLSVLDHVINNHRSDSVGLELRLAALLHDISKYKIHGTNPDGTFSYHGHEEDSAEIAKNILTRLKYSNSVIEEVCILIRNHMRMKSLYSYSDKSYTGTKKTMGRFIRSLETGPDARANRTRLENVLKLIDADNLSHSPKWNMPGQIDSFWKKYDAWFSNYKQPNYLGRINNPVNGKDIMDRFGLKPGKSIGYIKDEIIFGFVIDHPEYDKETLLDMYEAEFGGKSIYVWSGDFNHFCASIVKPEVIITRRGKTTSYDVKDYRDKLELDTEEREQLLPGDEVFRELKAIEYPELYIRIKIHKRSREVLDKAWDVLSELQGMPGFEKVSLDLDNSNDVSARVDWKDHRSDYIF